MILPRVGELWTGTKNLKSRQTIFYSIRGPENPLRRIGSVVGGFSWSLDNELRRGKREQWEQGKNWGVKRPLLPDHVFEQWIWQIYVVWEQTHIDIPTLDSLHIKKVNLFYWMMCIRIDEWHGGNYCKSRTHWFTSHHHHRQRASIIIHSQSTKKKK